MNTPTQHRSAFPAFRGLLLALVGLALGLPAGLAETNTGTLIGNVSESGSNLVLAGARIAVTDTSIEGFSDQQGHYTLAGVPAGTASVTISYVGYETKTVATTVKPGQINHLDFTIGAEVLKLAKLSVTASATGTARAINQERGAAALVSIMASDAIGELPDKNAAEALGRIPGVDVYRDKGEGRFVVVRGIDPIYTGTLVNGFQSATSEKSTREFPLDIIGADMISSIVVHKVNTPDLDADGLGGAIDIRTRTGFDTNGPQAAVTLGGNMNYNSPEQRQGGYKAEAFYGNQYDGGNLAAFVGIFSEARPYSVTNAENTGVWTSVTSPTDGLKHWFYNENDFRHYDLTRHRNGMNASLDFKIDDSSKLYLRVMTSYFIERESQYILGFPFSSGTITALTDTSATVSLKGVINSEAEIVDSKRITNVVGGYDKVAGPWTFNAALAYSVGEYNRHTPTVQYTTSAAGVYSYNFTSPWDVSISQVSGPSIDSPASYAFSTKSNFTSTTAFERQKTVHGDARYDFDLSGRPAYFKVGAMYREADKDQDTNVWTFGTSPFALASAAVPIPDFRFVPDQFGISPSYTQLFNTTPSAFTPTVSASKSALSDFVAQEDVAAAYAMAGVTVDKLKIYGGARFEETHFVMDGYSFDSTTSVVAPASGSRNYGNLLPGVIATYEVNPRNIFRASVTTSVQRPDWAATIIGRTIDDVNHLVTQGNPNLAPLQSVNYDISFEHYYSSLGVISAGFFYKDVKNFAYQAQSGTDPLTGYALTTYFNGPSAWIYAFELNWVQRFDFLPAPFDGLGVTANATLGNSNAVYPSRPGEKIPFDGFSRQFGNAGLSYEKRGLKLRLTASYHSARFAVDSPVGATFTQDPYEDAYTQLDFGSNYTFHHNWQAYFNVGNILNAHAHDFYHSGGAQKLLQNNESDGVTFDFGVKWIY